MPNVLDVAGCILQQRGAMTTWKLQKLVYYSQAWALVWDDDAIFPEEIEAWANGPVVRKLYNAHQGAACKTLIDSERRKNTQTSNDVRARQLARF